MDNETKKMFEILMNKLENMGIRQDEIFSVVKAIEFSNTENKAEIDNIIYKVAHTEGTLNKIGSVITDSKVIKEKRSATF